MTIDELYDAMVTARDNHAAQCLRLYALGKLLPVLNDVGWQEHTSDWDLCYVVTMNDGTIHNVTAMVMPLVTSDNLTLCVEAERIPTVLCTAFTRHGDEYVAVLAVSAVKTIAISSTAGA